jgi:hypothetical protein
VNRILASVAAGPRRVPGLAHRYPADAGLDGTPGQEAVTHQAPPAGVVDQLGMAREERRPLGFDLPRQQGCGLPAAEPPSMGPPLDRFGRGG